MRIGKRFCVVALKQQGWTETTKPFPAETKVPSVERIGCISCVLRERRYMVLQSDNGASDKSVRAFFEARL